MSEVAVSARNVPVLARPKVRAWLRLVAVVAIPLAAGAVAMELAQLVGVTGRGRSVAFYGVQLVAAIVVAQRTFGLRVIGLGRLPGIAEMAWPAALVGVRLVPWFLLIPVQGLTHEPVLLLSAFAYFLLFNAPAEEVLFRGLLLQGILGLGAGVLTAAAASSAVFALFHFGSGLLFLPVFAADALAFCALRLRTNSLYPPIAAHAALNFTTAALLISANVISDARAIDYVALVVAIDIAFWAESIRFRRRRS
jgi:membrane protease YdiL (CAAX protease family)